MSTPTRPLSAGEGLGALLSRSFNLLFAQLGLYVVIYLAVSVPVAVVTHLMVRMMGVHVSIYSPAGTAALMTLGNTALLALSVPGLVGGALVLGALLHTVRTQMGGGKTSLGEAFKTALSKWLPLVAVSVVTFAAVYMGLYLLVLPGLAALFFLCLAPIALMVDDAGVGQALSRSCSLALKVPGEIVVIGLIAFMATLVLGLIPLIGWLANAVVIPWTLIALTLAYGKAKKMATPA
ncbi:MAG TPA: hypothetical protein DHW14_09475 [Clostridiales bacterium]|nr:hypothetical protein [Clostridiales bacterium]